MVSRRGFCSLLGMTPLATKAAADKTLGELTGVKVDGFNFSTTSSAQPTVDNPSSRGSPKRDLF